VGPYPAYHPAILSRSRDTRCKLLHAAGGASEHQIRYIRTRNQEDQADNPEPGVTREQAGREMTYEIGKNEGTEEVMKLSSYTVALTVTIKKRAGKV